MSQSRGQPGPANGLPAGQQPPLMDQLKVAIFTQLRKQGPLQGWQSQITHNVRGGFIVQIFSNHRLARTAQLGTNIDPNEMKVILGSAIDYERKAFQQSPNIENYNAAIDQKLRHLTALRQQMSMGMQVGPGNHIQQPQSQPQPHQQPLMPSQQAFMGPSGLQQNQGPFPGNFQLGTGAQGQPQAVMNAPGNGNDIQRNMSRPQLASGQPQMGNSAATLAPVAPAANQFNGPMNPAEQNMLNQYTNLFMQQLHQTGRLEAVRKAAMDQLAPELLQRLRSANVDVAQYKCREEAFKTLQQKASSQGLAFPSQPNQPGLSQSFQSSIGTQGPGVTPANGASSIDFSQFPRQQADAKRSQEAGDLVVPASNNPGQASQLGQPGRAAAAAPGSNLPNTGNMNAAQQRPMQNMQPGPRPGPQPSMPQHLPNQLQGNVAIQSTPKRQPNAAMLTGQVGGLHASQQGQAPSPAMQWLNRPLAPPEEQACTPSSLHAPGPQRSHQASPQPGATGNRRQPQLPQATHVNQTAALNRPTGPHDLQPPPHMPEHIRNQLASLPRDQAQMLLRNFLLAQRANESKAQNQRHGQPMNAAAQSITAQQRSAGMNGQPPQHGHLTAQQSNGVRQPVITPSTQLNLPQPFPNLAPGQQLQPHDLELPRNRLKQIAPQLDIPTGVSNWGQLRQWLAQNPILLSQINEHSLQNVQVGQYNEYKRQAGLAVQPQRAGPALQPQPTATPNPTQRLPQGIPIPQYLLPQASMLAKRGIIRAANGLAYVHVTPAEVQAYRQQSTGRGQPINQSDDELRTTIMTIKLRKVAEEDAQWAQSLYRHAQAVMESSTNAGNPQIQRMQGQQPNQQPQLPQIQPGVNPYLQPGMQMRRPPQQSTPIGLAQQIKTMGQVDAPMRPSGLREAQQPQPKPFTQPTVNMTPVQGAQLGHRLAAAQIQNPGAQDQRNAAHDWQIVAPGDKRARFRQIMMETTQANPKGPAITYPADEHAMWTRNIGNMHRRLRDFMESIEKHYYERGMESLTREVLVCILRVKQQATVDAQTQRLVMQFNRTPQELKDVFSKLSHFYTLCMPKQSQGQAGSQPPRLPQQAQSQPGDMAQNPPALTRGAPKKPNQEAAGQASASKKGVVKAPPAAEASPPASFVMGTPTPDGRPVYAHGQNFSLHLPDKKRRRLNQNAEGATPASGPAASKKPAADLETVKTANKPMPDAAIMATTKAPPVEAKRPFKCSIPGCVFEASGFATKQEQLEHEASVHDYTGDQLEWCLKSMHKALGVGNEAEPNRGQSTQPAASSIAPRGVPADSQTGPKLVSNAASSVPSGGDFSRSHKGLTSAEDSSDAWAASSIRPEEIHALFGEIEGVTEIHPFGTGPIEWLSPPTPPPTHPSLSASPSDTVKDPSITSMDKSAPDSSVIDDPMTPDQDDWDKVELTKDSGLKRSAFDEMRDREAALGKKRRSFERGW